MGDDYVCDAKKRYQLKFGKIFERESIHRIPKISLPAKYEIVISSCDARVGRALFLFNDDSNEDNENADNHGASTPREGNDGMVVVALDSSSLVTPRPSVGKKKAKLMEFSDCHCHAAFLGNKTTANNKGNAATTTKVLEFDNLVTTH